MAEQVMNRDSASWKKAEHIVLREMIEDEIYRNKVVLRWEMLTAAEPVGRSIQKLYIPIAYEQYAKYNADGVCIGTGSMEDLWIQGGGV